MLSVPLWLVSVPSQPVKEFRYGLLGTEDRNRSIVRLIVPATATGSQIRDDQPRANDGADDQHERGKQLEEEDG